MNMLTNQCRRKRIFVGTSVAAMGASLLWSLPAFAQTSASDPVEETQSDSPEAANEGDAEIVVTAMRRAESLQDVPASVSALDDRKLERIGADSFEGFARVVPGLTLNEDSKNSSRFNIRGIATNVGPALTQEAVSVYINDAPVTDTFSAAVQPDLRLFDVERVEVLRGPQGTLFGSGSLGGTVRVITKKANVNEFEGAVRVDLANTPADDFRGDAFRQRYDLMVNVPIIQDKLAIRAVGYYRDEEGWVKNITLGIKNSTEDFGVRGSLLWTPSDATSVRLEAIYQKSDPDEGDAWNPAIGKFLKAGIIPTSRTLDFQNYNLVVEHDIPNFAQIVSSTTYQDSGTQYSSMSDGLSLGPLGIFTFTYQAPFLSKFLTQEVRAISNTDSPLEWVVGAFFIDRKSTVDSDIRLIGLNDALLALFGVPGPMGDTYVRTIYTSKSQELAAFANATYEFAPGWKATAGLRGFKAKVSYDEPDRRIVDFATLTVVSQSFTNRNKNSGIIWRGGLSYEPNEDILLYGSVGKGYRIGQVNPNRGVSQFDPTDIIIPEGYEPDSTINYELGAKTSFFDRKLTLNVAAFYIDWSNIQVGSNRLSDHANFVANAGKASSKGIEVEMAAHLGGLALELSTTLQDSKIDKISPEDSARSGVVEGDRLPGAIKFKIAGSAQYSWQLTDSLESYVRVDAQHIGGHHNGFSNLAGAPGFPNPYFRKTDAYQNVNASIGIVADHWEAAIYGENLTNNDEYIQDAGGLYANSVNTLRPRTFGIRGTYRF